MNAYCFIDGGHLRAISKKYELPLCHPRRLAMTIVYSEMVQDWKTPTHIPNKSPRTLSEPRTGLCRTVFYDAEPDDGASSVELDYWRAVETLPDTETGFGSVRGRNKNKRQKKVDSLIAVDMLTGAFDSLFDVAILVSGDADFVPIVEAVKRRGVMVVVAAAGDSLANELERSADRVWPIAAVSPEGGPSREFPPLWDGQGQTWHVEKDGKVVRRDLA